MFRTKRNSVELRKKRLHGNKKDPFFNRSYQNDLYKIACIVGMKLTNADFNFNDTLDFSNGFKNVADIKIRKTNPILKNISRNMLFNFCIKKLPNKCDGKIIKSHTFIYYYCKELALQVKELGLEDVIQRNITNQELYYILGFQQNFIHHYSNHSCVSWIDEVYWLDKIISEKNFYEF